jgi:hypothetical protein
MQLIILGMHRSGTSSIAGFFQQSGMYFGPPDQAFDLHATNRKGFFERRDVVRINDRLLESAGASWITPERFPRSTPLPYEGHVLATDAKAIVADLNRHSHWFVKDPRMCVTLPFWSALITNPVYLLVLRNPLNVAKSLANRGDCSIPTGLALWECYTRDMFLHTQGANRVVVSFEAIMADPATEITRVFSELTRVTGERLAAPRAEAIEAWFDRNLVHHASDDSDLAEYATVSIGNLYDRLRNSLDDSSIVTEGLSLSSRRLLRELEQFCHDRAERLEHQKAWRNRLAMIAKTEQDRARKLRTDVEALLQSWRWKIPAKVFDALGRPPDQLQHGFNPDAIRRDLDAAMEDMNREFHIATHPSLMFPLQRYPQENPEIRTNPISLRILLASPHDLSARTGAWMVAATRKLTSFGHLVNWLSLVDSRQQLINTADWPAFDFLVSPERDDMMHHVMAQHDVLLWGPDNQIDHPVLRAATAMKLPWFDFTADDLDIRYGEFYPRPTTLVYDVGLIVRHNDFTTALIKTWMSAIRQIKPQARMVLCLFDQAADSDTTAFVRQQGGEVIEALNDPGLATRIAGLCSCSISFVPEQTPWFIAAGVPVLQLDPTKSITSEHLSSFLHHPEKHAGVNLLDAMNQRHALGQRWQKIILALNEVIPAPSPA